MKNLTKRLYYTGKGKCPFCKTKDQDLYWSYYQGKKTAVCELCIEGAIRENFDCECVKNSDDLMITILSEDEKLKKLSEQVL